MRIILPTMLFLLVACISHHAPAPDESPVNKAQLKLAAHAAELQAYAKSKKASTTLGILVDMSAPSWKKRLFVVNLNTDSVLVAGLCAHGQCDDIYREEVKFSNTVGSNCTAMGHYRIGGKYTGEYGEAYKLFGLDSTNSNAFARNIVFHYYPSVPDEEDKGACRSNGCPMVSPKVFAQAAVLLDASKKPVLLWIYK
ncbi:MAG TPA: murein L,D-transpeptidase catalytic domain family protein [Chitinophagales bacterium]|nr:murein L,D-transpeptidase catalytic domain family protein [Chitinophagales bacterium]